MKPKKLTMVAFGPYGEEQVIDFEKLVDTNIFLIHGPTGAGKTTILDAMCYALYGYTNGGERSAENMRSKFAQPQQGAEVELIFTVHGQDYRVTRSPRFERPKLKGEGTTEQLPKVNLSEWDGEKFITLTEKQTDVDKKINELLRFNIDQFRQVIMIAQNKFRELLTVDSKERQKILQDIFETGVYENIEQKLDQINSSLVEKSKMQQVQYTALLNNIEDQEHEVLKQYIETKVLKNAPQVIEILNEISADKEVQKAGIENELTALKEKLDNIQDKLVLQTEKYNALIRSKEVKVKLQELYTQKDYYNHLNEQVKWSEKASQLIPVEKAIDEIESKIQEKIKDITQTTTQLANIKKQLEELQAHKDQLNTRIPEVEALKREHSVLETYLPRVEELAINQKERLMIEQEVNRQKQLIQEKLLQIQKANDYILKAEEAIETKEVLTKKLNEQKLYSQKVEQVLGLNQDIEVKQKQLDEARIKYSQLSKEIQGLRQQEILLVEEYDELFNKWLSNQAGEIAKVLEVNRPCPVCGSTNHPVKATITHTNIDLDEIRKREAAKLQLNGTIKQKQEEQNNIKEAGVRLAGEVEALKTRAKSLIEQHEEIKKLHLEQSIEVMTELETQIEKINKDQKQMQIYRQKLGVFEEEKVKLEEALKEYQIKVSQLVTKIESVQKELPENLQSKEALQVRLASIIKQYKQIENDILKVNQSFEAIREEYAKLEAGLAEKNSQSNTLVVEKEHKVSCFKNELELLGFKEETAYKEAKAIIDQIPIFKEQIEDYATNKIVLENTLKDIEIQVSGFNEEELMQTKTIHQQYTNQRDDYQILYNRLVDYIARHQKIIQQIEELYLKSMEVIRKQDTLGKIAGLAKGKNSKGISFETYIQSSIFEQVLNSANSRLKPMTSSRYELYREEDRQDRRKRAGLDIAVKDNYVGQTRPVNTLSGGESFMAALALALGLSDVISRLAGATALDTMFIDEGFGTLDEEALDLAIKTLLNLGDTGRLVGIISHVKELKEQIPARLEIIATNTGSKAEFKM